MVVGLPWPWGIYGCGASMVGGNIWLRGIYDYRASVAMEHLWPYVIFGCGAYVAMGESMAMRHLWL